MCSTSIWVRMLLTRNTLHETTYIFSVVFFICIGTAKCRYFSVSHPFFSIVLMPSHWWLSAHFVRAKTYNAQLCNKHVCRAHTSPRYVHPKNAIIEYVKSSMEGHFCCTSIRLYAWTVCVHHFRSQLFQTRTFLSENCSHQSRLLFTQLFTQTRSNSPPQTKEGF